MRLWHYALLPVLPNKMLVSQWRECIAIKRQWEKGTLNHRLVSYVKDYDKSYYLTYVEILVNEMVKRNINFNVRLYKEIQDFCKKDMTGVFMGNNYYPEHNDKYLKQCLYNLEEKYDRGIISQEEWDKISKRILTENLIATVKMLRKE